MADDITQWLEGLGLGQYAEVFAENDVDFEVLPNLSDDNLIPITAGYRTYACATDTAICACFVQFVGWMFSGKKTPDQLGKPAP